MIGVILNILVACIYVVLIKLIFKKRKIIEGTENYEFMTSYPRTYIILSYVFLVISLIFHLVASIVSLNNENNTVMIFFYLGLGFGIFTLILFYDLLLDYEAIRDDYLYVRRAFKLKKIPIKDIYQRNINSPLVSFYDKDGNRLFFMDGTTKGIFEFYQLLDDKLSQYEREIKLVNFLDPSIKVKDNSNEEILKQIGDEYKDKLSKKIYFNKMVILFSTVLFVVFIYLLFLSYLMEFIILLIIFYFIFIFSIGKTINKLKNEQNMRPLTLGKKYYYDNEKVKGSSVYKFHKLKSILISISISFFFIGAIFLMISLSSKNIEKSNLLLISGKVDYIEYYYHNERNELAIGLENDNIEYRISSLSLDATNKDDLLGDVKPGDTINLYASKDHIENISYVDVTKEKWAYVYEVYTSNKYYLTFEDYLVLKEKDDKIGWGVSIGSLSIAAMSFGALFYYKNKMYKEKENEYIEIK